MKCDQVYYTSSTTGTRGGAGFQINAHSGTLESDIQREVEAYSLYTPPANCPRTPETQDDFACFPVSYRYRRFAGRRAGISRSLYLGKDYNAVRYGNFFTHIILAGENEFFDQLQDPVLMADLDLWASTASTVVHLPDLNLTLPATSRGDTDLRPFQTHPRFCDLLSYCMAGLSDRKSTVIVDSQPNIAMWISAVLKALPPGVRKRISFSTYEYTPQNLDYNLCGTTSDSGFDFSEASFRFNYYVMDFSSDRFSPSLEHSYYAKIVTRIINLDNHQILNSFLAFIQDVSSDPEPAQLDSLAELWSILNEKDNNASILRALHLMKEFRFTPPRELVQNIQAWALTYPSLESSELNDFWNYIYAGFIASETNSQRILSWSYTLLVIMLKHYPNSDQTNILKSLELIQGNGGLLHLESYEPLVTELKARLQNRETDRFFLLKICRELRLSDHPELLTLLQNALSDRILSRPLDVDSLELVSSSLMEGVPYVESTLVELMDSDSPKRGAVPLILKLIPDPEQKNALKNMLLGRGRPELWESIELYELFSQAKWEESAARWWLLNRVAPNKLHLHTKFWAVAQAIHPSWAPLDYLVKDPALIRYPSFIKAFWDTISTYNPLNQYEKRTTDLLDSLSGFISSSDKSLGLSKDCLDLGEFIKAYHDIFYSNDTSTLGTVKSILNLIPIEYAQYKPILSIQLIKRLNTPSRKGSDWESLLEAVWISNPKSIAFLLEKEESILQEFPAVFWVGMIRLAVSHGSNLSGELHRLIKHSIKNLPEKKMYEINDKLRDKPLLAEYIRSNRHKNILMRILSLFKR